LFGSTQLQLRLLGRRRGRGEALEHLRGTAMIAGAHELLGGLRVRRAFARRAHACARTAAQCCRERNQRETAYQGASAQVPRARDGGNFRPGPGAPTDVYPAVHE
jgi:hypothetical protein